MSGRAKLPDDVSEAEFEAIARGATSVYEVQQACRFPSREYARAALSKRGLLDEVQTQQPLGQREGLHNTPGESAERDA